MQRTVVGTASDGAEIGIPRPQRDHAAIDADVAVLAGGAARLGGCEHCVLRRVDCVLLSRCAKSRKALMRLQSRVGFFKAVVFCFCFPRAG